jgi:hypothetical protein
MSSGSKGQWFKVRFNKDGLANFWINSAGLSNDLDLYIYEAQDTEGIKLGSSTNSPGSDKADDIVRDIPVTAGKEYIYILRTMEEILALIKSKQNSIRLELSN